MQNQIENTLNFDVAWPPAELSPNARVSWAQKAAAAKQYKSDCYYLAVDARNRWQQAHGLKWPVLRRAWLRLTFIQPDNRARDLDNLVAACKPLIDALCLPGREGDYGASLIATDDAKHLSLESPEVQPGDRAMVQVRLASSFGNQSTRMYAP